MELQRASGEPRAFDLTDRFDAGEMSALMARPDVYWPARDALAPQPEDVDFADYMLHPDVATFAGTAKGHIIGYVQFIRRTSVMAEIVSGWHPQFRGLCAKTMIRAAIAIVFAQRGVLKIMATIPDDNKPARRLVGNIGFKCEARLRNSIVRTGRTPPLADLLIYTLERGALT